MAPTGQILMQVPHEVQTSASIIITFSLNLIAPAGHAPTHATHLRQEDPFHTGIIQGGMDSLLINPVKTDSMECRNTFTEVMDLGKLSTSEMRVRGQG